MKFKVGDYVRLNELAYKKLINNIYFVKAKRARILKYDKRYPHVVHLDKDLVHSPVNDRAEISTNWIEEDPVMYTKLGKILYK